MGLLKNGKDCSRTKICSFNRRVKKPFKSTSYRNFAKRNNETSLLRSAIKSLKRRATLQLPDGTQQIDFPAGTRIMLETSEIPLMPDAIEAYSDPDRMPLKIDNHNYQSCPLLFSALHKYPLDGAAIASELADGMCQPVHQDIPDVEISKKAPKSELAFSPSRRKTWSVEAGQRVVRQVNLPSWTNGENSKNVDEVPFCELRLNETFESEQKETSKNGRKKWVLDFIPGSQSPVELPNWAKAKSSRFVRSVKPAVQKDGIGLLGAHPQSAIKPFRANPVPATTYKASLPVAMKRHQFVKEKVKADMIKDMMLEPKPFRASPVPPSIFKPFPLIRSKRPSLVMTRNPPIPQHIKT